jgi:hypothetical protein
MKEDKRTRKDSDQQTLKRLLESEEPWVLEEILRFIHKMQSMLTCYDYPIHRESYRAKFCQYLWLLSLNYQIQAFDMGRDFETKFPPLQELLESLDVALHEVRLGE